MTRFNVGIAAAFILISALANAGVIVGGTRVIYQEGKREATIAVTNSGTATPYLVQSWVENNGANPQAAVPFIVTPPLFRLDPETRNVLRITFTGGALPGDRESVYWLNIKSIAPTQQEDANKLQVNIKSKFKIFYRPAKLTGDPERAWQQLQFSISGNQLIARNPTPYYISLFSLAVAGHEVDEPGMVAPFSTQTWPVTASGRVTWRAINDYGGVTDVAD